MPTPDISRLSVSFRERNLCTRCGTCIGVCPVGALQVGAECFPELNPDLCIHCGRCGDCCPGGRVSYSELSQITFGEAVSDADDFDGHLLESCLAHATDDSMRRNGASGGAATAILADLLERGTVDGCVVARMVPQEPWRGESFVARSREELISAQQSLYLCIPVNAIIEKLRKNSGRFAIVALPCQVHGLRLAMAKDNTLAGRIVCIVGLFCATTIQPAFTIELLKMRGIKPKEIESFRFRDGPWPGRICAVLADGISVPLHHSNFKDGAINYMAYLYSPPRCQICLDGSAEFADISAADAWARDASGSYRNQGETRLLIRTAKGREIVRDACRSGALERLEGSDEETRHTPRHHFRKKAITHRLRLARWRSKGCPVTETDRYAPPADPADRLLERAESALMWIGAHPCLRRPLFAFLTSRAGVPLIWLRQLRKRRRYRHG